MKNSKNQTMMVHRAVVAAFDKTAAAYRAIASAKDAPYELIEKVKNAAIMLEEVRDEIEIICLG